MAKFDSNTDLQIATGMIATLSGTTPAKSNIVDMAGFDSLTFSAITGTVTDAGTTAGFSFEVQESDTTADAAFTAVADADLVGLESALTVTDDAYDNKPIGTIGYIGSKRYVRVVVTGTTGTSAVIAVIANKRHAACTPASNIADNVAAT